MPGAGNKPDGTECLAFYGFCSALFLDINMGRSSSLHDNTLYFLILRLNTCISLLTAEFSRIMLYTHNANCNL